MDIPSKQASPDEKIAKATIEQLQFISAEA